MALVITELISHPDNDDKKHNSGQTIVEYIIIIVIVAVAAFAIIGLFSDRIRTVISGAVSSISDESDQHALSAQDINEENSTDILNNMDEHGIGYY
jgi:Flp pilus assembly pilin Flp